MTFFSSKTRGDTAAAYYSQGKISINEKHPYWRKPGDYQMSIEEIVYHEIGHMIYNAPDNFFSLEHQDIARLVSKYAGRNPKEFVSETYARIKIGKKFPDKVMNLYRMYARTR